MPKEFRFAFTAQLPDDVLDQDDVMAKVKPLLRQFIADANAAIGEDKISTESKVVSPKPKAAPDKPSAEIEKLPVRGHGHAA